mmetsp:Transcript_51911/g.129182  ORF Transcript_51911/g.129182 Transcript_51911/m.129182 type:complete len:269 (-) Transcript_51911:53-859(-)
MVLEANLAHDLRLPGKHPEPKLPRLGEGAHVEHAHDAQLLLDLLVLRLGQLPAGPHVARELHHARPPVGQQHLLLDILLHEAPHAALGLVGPAHRLVQEAEHLGRELVPPVELAAVEARPRRQVRKPNGGRARPRLAVDERGLLALVQLREKLVHALVRPRPVGGEGVVRLFDGSLQALGGFSVALLGRLAEVEYGLYAARVDGGDGRVVDLARDEDLAVDLDEGVVVGLFHGVGCVVGDDFEHPFLAVAFVCARLCARLGEGAWVLC